MSKFQSNDITAWSCWKDLPPAISADETIELIREYQKYGTIEARDKAAFGNMRFVVYMISKYGDKALNCQGFYPSFEDLAQEGMLVTLKSIEKFKPDYNFTFATFLARALTNMFGMQVRAAKGKIFKEVRFSDSVAGTGKRDEEDMSLEDMLEEEKYTPEWMNSALELHYIRSRILPLIPRKDRKIFEDVVFNNMTHADVGVKYNYTTSMVTRMVVQVRDKITRMYLNGIKDIDKLLHGVDLSYVRDAFEQGAGVINKWGKGFLRDYFVPTLPKNQKAVFEKGVLYYAGQTLSAIGKDLGMNPNDVKNHLTRALLNLEETGPKLMEMQANGEIPKERKMHKSIVQKINRTERLIEQYGGRVFLTKYFLPTLPERERKIFKLGVLEYSGDSVPQMAKKINMIGTNFSTKLAQIVEKLRTTDFEAVAEVVDNAKNGQELHLSADNLARVKERQALVEKYGGIIKLKELFVPILTEPQKELFQEMFLHPRFDSMMAYASEHGITCAYALNIEKKIREKLESVDFVQLEGILARAEEHVKVIRYEKTSKTKGGKARIVQKCGGKEFLREVFIPTLKVPAHRVIFELSFLQGRPMRYILRELNLKSKALPGIVDIDRQLYARLKDFGKSFENLDEAVKEFYARKGFEKDKTTKVEKTNVSEPENVLTIENAGMCKNTQKRLEFLDSWLNQFGDKKVLARKFIPSLKKPSQQIVFTVSFLEGCLDSEVCQEFGYSMPTLRTTKREVVQKLKDFNAINSKNKPKDNSGKKVD